MSNSLDPDQAQHCVRPDLGLNCLRRLSADKTSKQRIKVGVVFEEMNPLHTFNGPGRNMSDCR